MAVIIKSRTLHSQLRNNIIALVYAIKKGSVAQLIEHLTTDQKVVGLNPAGITKEFRYFLSELFFYVPVENKVECFVNRK